MIRRVLLLVGAIVPVTGVMALMAWALGQTDGNPGGLGVYNVFGEVEVEAASAPPLSLRLLTGEALTLADLEGKVVMVDFWSSWCPPCIKEAQVLASTYPLYADRSVVFVGVAIWDVESEVNRYIARFGVTYPNGVDAQGKVAINYGVRGVPEKFFIDRNGLLVKKFVGPVTAEQLQAIIDEMLSQGDEA
jgi:cytochrome c biogenesis protein CcmG/thiol:disulfide interchange protein DsbE